MRDPLKHDVVLGLDWICTKIFRHRIRRLCHLIAVDLESWWPDDEWTSVEPDETYKEDGFYA